MSLKPQADKTPTAAPSPIAWGVLADAGESAAVIRFECADGSYSYPYHVLSRWVLQTDDSEILVIDAGRDKITIRGRKLEIVRESLDAGRLRVLRVCQSRYAVTESGVTVTDLAVESAASEQV